MPSYRLFLMGDKGAFAIVLDGGYSLLEPKMRRR